jgi:hypothetical protein
MNTFVEKINFCQGEEDCCSTSEEEARIIFLKYVLNKIK